ncbi:hypothetical protein [Hydrocarboniphaga effusa]|jgi:hypothetical protein|uniref:hypothetical protein n=1 Tax=Hydrocarboniphaga effusa TaxID=243629 RepID=UPI0035B2BDAC
MRQMLRIAGVAITRAAMTQVIAATCEVHESFRHADGEKSMNTVLQLILLFALSGVALSGYWTWRGLTSEASKACASVAQAEVFLGYPLYTFGLILYVLIVALAVAALWRSDDSSAPARRSR